MGKAGISGKQPMDVAIAIAAQVMDLYQKFDAASDKNLTTQDWTITTKETLEHV
jgi:xanthine/CO dehydrogenase XdhC/CoxF family maturation factor